MNEETIKIGDFVLNYKKQQELEKAERIKASQIQSEKNRILKTGKRGRPRKAEKDKIRQVSLKLPPDYVEYLENFAQGKGLGTKIRFIIDKYRILRSREQKQLRLIDELLEQFNKDLDKFLKTYKKQSEQAKQLQTSLQKKSEDMRIILRILQIPLRELETMLTEDQRATLNLLLRYHEGISNNGSH